jgi:hypothetical protein
MIQNRTILTLNTKKLNVTTSFCQKLKLIILSHQNMILPYQGSEGSKIVLMWRGGTWKPTFSEVTNTLTWDWKPSQEVISGQGARYLNFQNTVIHRYFRGLCHKDISKIPKLLIPREQCYLGIVSFSLLI